MSDPAASPQSLRIAVRTASEAARRRWRSAVDPGHVGLPARKRRQPGLTSADVAELSGLSLCWYTQLEGGSVTHRCSSRAVDRVATALRLAEADRARTLAASRVDWDLDFPKVSTRVLWMARDLDDARPAKALEDAGARIVRGAGRLVDARTVEVGGERFTATRAMVI